MTSMTTAPARERFALDVLQRLRQAGHESYWAGGCVRDLLMGHTPSDYDVATGATPEQVMALFPHTVPVGVSFIDDLRARERTELAERAQDVSVSYKTSGTKRFR